LQQQISIEKMQSKWVLWVFVSSKKQENQDKKFFLFLPRCHYRAFSYAALQKIESDWDNGKTVGQLS
jgi:hypothetical protein